MMRTSDACATHVRLNDAMRMIVETQTLIGGAEIRWDSH